MVSHATPRRRIGDHQGKKRHVGGGDAADPACLSEGGGANGCKFLSGFRPEAFEGGEVQIRRKGFGIETTKAIDRYRLLADVSRIFEVGLKHLPDLGRKAGTDFSGESGVMVLRTTKPVF